MSILLGYIYQNRMTEIYLSYFHLSHYKSNTDCCRIELEFMR